MKALVLKQFGSTENFSMEEISEPQVGKGEVLIQVKAIGINPVDVKTRAGGGQAAQYKENQPIIIGWDVAGIVTKAADDITGFAVGDEVFGTINFPGTGGAYAQYALCPAAQIAKKPANISFEEAAASTLSALTAWQALVDTGHIKKGDQVLIHGGAGGVGNYAIQIARHIGCHVITTAGTGDMDFVKSIGADEVIDYKNQKFEEMVKDLDFILDTVGGENFVRSLQVLKPDGIIVLLPSNKKEEADKAAREHHIKNYRHILMHSDGEDMQHIAAMLTDGSLKVHIDKTFPFNQIPQAHQEMENGKVKGKIVITV